MSLRALWIGLLGAPVVWMIYLEVNYILGTAACVSVPKTALGVVTAVSIVLSLGAGMMAWRGWTLFGGSFVDDGGEVVDRNRFLAIVGLGLAALFTLLLAAGGIPIFILQPCD